MSQFFNILSTASSLTSTTPHTSLKYYSSHLSQALLLTPLSSTTPPTSHKHYPSHLSRALPKPLPPLLCVSYMWYILRTQESETEYLVLCKFLDKVDKLYSTTRRTLLESRKERPVKVITTHLASLQSHSSPNNWFILLYL